MNFNRWFKAQGADFLNMRLRRLPAGLFKFHYFARCVAACNGGALPAVEELAFLLGSRPATIERRLAALREAGLVEEAGGELRPVEFGDAGEGEERDGEDEGMTSPLTPAERTRRWRERRARRDDAVTPGASQSVTQERDRESNSDQPLSPGVTVYARFDEFWNAFPSRDGDNPKAPALSAWRKAVAGGADPAAIIAGAKAYAAATVGRERRFIVGAARWLAEQRWLGDGAKDDAPSPVQPAGAWIKQGSPEWEAWTAHWQATKGKRPPIDAKGGWRFPSRWPQGLEAMVMAAE